eukprot:TRINITY_DN4076_c0_g1_i1.p1 TRINITY_DN4076_c0_g1~~TRINITY_DN4076_c0_g1_i1.p1  ORF type:complete len:578 (+),score=137.23 TRINITY_DN4076_c0_g1_i1:44-1777(+)
MGGGFSHNRKAADEEHVALAPVEAPPSTASEELPNEEVDDFEEVPPLLLPHQVLEFEQDTQSAEIFDCETAAWTELLACASTEKAAAMLKTFQHRALALRAQLEETEGSIRQQIWQYQETCKSLVVLHEHLRAVESAHDSDRGIILEEREKEWSELCLLEQDEAKEITFKEKHVNAATTIQAGWRAVLARRELQELQWRRNKLISIQSFYRWKHSQLLQRQVEQRLTELLALLVAEVTTRDKIRQTEQSNWAKVHLEMGDELIRAEQLALACALQKQAVAAQVTVQDEELRLRSLVASEQKVEFVQIEKEFFAAMGQLLAEEERQSLLQKQQRLEEEQMLRFTLQREAMLKEEEDSRQELLQLETGDWWALETKVPAAFAKAVAAMASRVLEEQLAAQHVVTDAESAQRAQTELTETQETNQLLELFTLDRDLCLEAQRKRETREITLLVEECDYTLMLFITAAEDAEWNALASTGENERTELELALCTAKERKDLAEQDALQELEEPARVFICNAERKERRVLCASFAEVRLHLPYEEYLTKGRVPHLPFEPKPPPKNRVRGFRNRVLQAVSAGQQ